MYIFQMIFLIHIYIYIICVHIVGTPVLCGFKRLDYVHVQTMTDYA